jgi:glycerate 2-kinase
VGERLSRAEPETLCLVFGGETTVRLRQAGKGGRCMEMATAVAPRIERLNGAAFLAAGTDGTDGPTEYAGGWVEQDSCERAGGQWRDALRRHDSLTFLERAGGLIRTGPTDSNVNDLALFVIA